MRTFLIAFFALLTFVSVAQLPITQFEGYIEVINSQSQNSTFVGKNSGQSSTGSFNSFFGYQAGRDNTTGSYNNYFGFGAGSHNMTGQRNNFFGTNAGRDNTGSHNTYIGDFAGAFLSGDGNTFIGRSTGTSIFSGNYNTLLGHNAEINSGGLSYATAIGAESTVSTSNTVVLGRSNDKAIAPGTMIIGDETSPRGDLNVYANSGNANVYLEAANSNVGFNIGISQGVLGTAFPTMFIAHYDGSTYYDRVRINQIGTVSLNVLGAAGSTQLCRNTNNEISSCSSSIRYKKEITSFSKGLDIIDRLAPVRYKWKASEVEDIGFIAEEVGQLDERFITRNVAGEIEGVKYDRLTTILVNAIKEQQKMIQELSQNMKETESLLNQQQTLNQLVQEEFETILSKIEKLESKIK